jgi:uncharacterized protein YjeT (DUF2065 family)
VRNYGYFLIVAGALYEIKPDLFRRWFWKKTSIAQRTLSPENYIRYMRLFGAVLIVVGLVLVVRG